MTPVRTVEDFAIAFATMQREQADGFLVPSSPLTNSQPVASSSIRNGSPRKKPMPRASSSRLARRLSTLFVGHKNASLTRSIAG